MFFFGLSQGSRFPTMNMVCLSYKEENRNASWERRGKNTHQSVPGPSGAATGLRAIQGREGGTPKYEKDAAPDGRLLCYLMIPSFSSG